jgi:hypothetical protein
VDGGWIKEEYHKVVKLPLDARGMIVALAVGATATLPVVN